MAVEVERGEKVAEGKTKIIWEMAGDPDHVLIESKDDITAGDGAKHDLLPGKGVLATTTTCNCFRLLGQNDILTHFIQQIDERTFLARKVEMIPIELVARRIATGSYLKRHPRVTEGSRFIQPEIEFFLKDDERHDPLMIWDEDRRCFRLYDAKKPLRKGYIEDLNRDYPFAPVCSEEAEDLEQILREVFLVLERAWAQQNVVLVDLKIECGYVTDNSQDPWDDGVLTIDTFTVVADVIDNDSWRIWPQGDKSQMRDKQVYRDSGEMTEQTIKAIQDNYAWVAEATKRFLV